MKAGNLIEKLSDTIFKIEGIIVMLLVTVMFVSLTAGVFFRYYLNSPLFWSDEIAIFTLIWLTFFGGSMTIKRQQSAAVTILVDKLKKEHRKIILSIGFAIVALFSLLVLYYSFAWLSSPNILLQRSDSMQIPMLYPYLCVPIGFFFMSIHSIALCVASSRGGV